VADSEDRKRLQKQLTQAKQRRAKQHVSSDQAVSPVAREAALPASLREPDDIAKGVAIVRNPDEDPGIRESVLGRLSIAAGKSHELIDLVLNILTNRADPPGLRLTALRVLQELSFSSGLFQTRRADYLAALREVVSDADAGLREPALEILALKKDEYAQRILLNGLRTPSEAIVPPEKAIQMLGYDVHAEHYPILRELLANPPNAAAKEEAVRALAGDPGSQQLLTDVLVDKAESLEVRKLSALALGALAPEAFAPHAKRIVADDDDEDDLRATVLTSLTSSGDQKALRDDAEFQQHVERLKARSSSGAAGRAAASFLAKQKKG